MIDLLDTIRKAVEASDKTCYRISKDTGLSPSQLSRLLSRERGLRVETLQMLAEYLDLEIVIRPKRLQKGR